VDFSGCDSHGTERYCICDEMVGRAEKEGDANICTERKSMSSECDKKEGGLCDTQEQ
jgi:hypothetical protein